MKATADTQTATWQPIETAPKDGERIMLADVSDGYVSSGFYDQSVWNHGWVTACDRSDADTIDPTHWMPLPEPPKDAK
jgi:hypothetical protein